MRYFLLLLFSLFTTFCVAQTYTVVIDGRLPPGTSFPSPSWADGTSRVQGGDVNYEFRNWDRNDPNFDNVQFYEEISGRTITTLNLRTFYSPAVPGCTPTGPSSLNFTATELIPTPSGGGGGFNYCSAYFSVDAVPEMTITGPTNGTITCAGRTIDLGNAENFPIEAYTWNFRIRNPMGVPVTGGGRIPSTFFTPNPNTTIGGGIVSFSMIDLLGTDVANHIGNTVEFYLGANSFVFSNSISIIIDNCTPFLGERYPTNTSCSDSEDGSVEVALLSGLDPTDNESLLLTINTVTPEGFVIPEYNVDIIALNSTSNGPNTFSLPNLVPGTYEIDYQSYIDPDGAGGEAPYPNGLGIPFTFEILAPSPVLIDDVVLIQDPSCPGEFGSRRIEVSGGQDFQSGTYQYTKDGGTSWETSPNPNSITYDDLAPGADYSFGVKLVLSATNECFSDSSFDQTIPDITNPLMLAPGSGVSRQPSSAGATDGIIFAQVIAGSPQFIFALYSTADPVTAISSTPAQTGRTHQFVDLGIGTYFIQITDGNGCEVNNEGTPFELTAASLPTLGTSSTTSPTCNGGNDGSASVSVTNPTPTTISYELRDGTTVVKSGDIPNITTGTINIAAPLQAGNYILYVISDAGDFSNSATVVTADVIINDPSEVAIDSFAANDISCFGANNGSISVTASGGTNYQYTLELIPNPADWQPLIGNSIENLSGGFYYLTIRNESGCQSATINNTEILVREPDELVVTEDQLLHQNVSTTGGNDGAFVINVSGGTGPFTYTWLKDGQPFVPPTGSTETNLISLQSGVYDLTVSEIGPLNCSATLTPSITVSEPGPLSIEPLTGTDSCNGSDNGTITATVQGTGNLTFEFLEEVSGDVVYNVNNTPDRTVTAPNLAPGSYGLRVTEETSTNTTTTPLLDYFTITELTPITATTTPTDLACNETNTGIITVTGAIGGSNTGFEYAIDDNFGFQLENTFTGLAPREYEVTVRDDLGCTYITTVEVIKTGAPILNDLTTIVNNASSDTDIDGSIILEFETDPTNYTYAWSGPGVNGRATKDLVGIGAGTYQVVVTASVNCEITIPFTVGVQTDFSIQPLTGTANICFGQTNGSVTATFVATGIVTFNWFNADDPTTPFATGTTNLRTLSIQDRTAGIYYIELVDVNDSKVRSTDFQIVASPEVSATVVPVATCLGESTGSIIFTDPVGSPSDSYRYSIDNGVTFQENPLFENLAAVSYTPRMQAIDNPNCDFIAPGVTITTSPGIFWDEPNTLITRASGLGANDGAIVAAFTGGTVPLTYIWSANVITSDGANATGLGAGQYSVSVTDAAGCSISQPFEITEVGPLTITNIVPTNVVCKDEANGSITTTVTGEGIITYLWTLGNGSPVPVSNGVNSANITGILAGTYILTATDDNATVSTSAITITEPATSVTIINITPTDVSCFGGNDGAIEIQAAGGIGPYTYSINGGAFQAAPLFNNLIANSYSVRVQDSNGCEFVEPTPVLLIEPEELNLIINEQRPVSAANATDGAIFITVEGGSGNYTYEWSGANSYTSTDEDPLNLAAGDYNLTVTDANFAVNNGAGCRLFTTQPITITEPGEIIVNLIQTVLLPCSGDNFAEITANVQGGVPPYTYEWFQGNNTLLEEDTNIIGNLSPGSYFVRATDSNLITIDSNPIIITAPTLLQLTIDNTTNVVCPGQPTGSINITVSGGTPPYQYFWSNSATVADITGLDAGEYTVEVEDAAGCITDNTITITAPDEAIQIADASVNNVSAYQALDGSISVDISGGSTPYTYVWTRLSNNSNAGNQATISNLGADSYSVSISDVNGCTVSDTYVVTQPDIVEETVVQPSCLGDSDGSISVLVNQGNGAFTYLWNTGATENNIINLTAGSYSVTVTGFEDGPVTRTYVLENPVPLVVNLGVNRVLCADQTLELDATVDDATASYAWSSDNGFSSSNPIVVLSETGNYNVTVQSQSGCTAQGTIFVDVSTDEIDAEFAMSSQVFVGETAVVVDISYPLPDGIEWIVPIGAEVIAQDQDAAEFSFAEAGEYDITIITTRGGCIAQKTKKIIVVAVDGLIQEDDSKTGQKLVEEFIVYPNPTTGKFTADINLTEQGDVSIKVFNFANNTMMASERGREKTSYSIPFDISGMPSGVYAVLLETPYGTSLRKVIVR